MLPAEEKALLIEIRDLLREALPHLRSGQAADEYGGLNVSRVLQADDPIEAIKEHNRRAKAAGRVKKRVTS